MALLTDKNFKTEIVSPAGSLEKLRFSVLYGADTVYFGGDEFNLRIKAGNFSHEDITEGLAFCKSHGVKAVFLINSFIHENDIEPLKKYINDIKKYTFDAFMVSDPSVMLLLREAGINTELHLSTQMSVLNHVTLNFWKKIGFKRIVLGRETSLEEIKKIRGETDVEIEIFAHGALCVAYSGRCLLSRYLTGRDANQGDCSQPCRWNYTLVEKKRPGYYMDVLESEKGTEILSSKDLCLIERLEEYVAAGVNAFKLEGRMKSLYHAANTTRIYKDALLCAGTESFKTKLPFYIEELDLISHRPYTSDLFNEFDKEGFRDIPYVKKALLAAYKISDEDQGRVAVKTFNPVYRGDVLDAIYPIIDGRITDHKATALEIFDSENNQIEMARPGDTVTIKFDTDIGDNSILRRRL